MAEVLKVAGKTGGFVRESDGSLRYVARVPSGSSVTTYSESNFAVQLYHSKGVVDAPVGMMDSARLNSSLQAKTISAPATATKPADRNPPPMPPAEAGPSEAEVIRDELKRQEEERKRAEDARREEQEERNRRDMIATLKSEFPWLEDIGLDPQWFQNMAAEASGAAEMLVKLRGTPQYKKRFPGMYRADGSIRMNEREYMDREQDFRSLLRQYGFDTSDYTDPSSMIGFFDSEMDPNEFQSRLQTYRGVQQSSQAKKDAFYVYAGLDISDDDLYQAIVDPGAAQRLTDEYNQAVASGSLDYGMWITRATEVGARRVADTLTKMQRQGAVTGRAVQAVLSINPEFARQIMDALYTGGSGNVQQSTMSLEDLLSSFEYAAIGAAASEAGLDLPTKERLAEIRQAGVERAAAIQAYQSYGLEAAALSATVQRAGYNEFTQDEFERARFLGQADPMRQLREGVALEEAAGKSSGEFRFADEGGRLIQRGFGLRR